MHGENMPCMAFLKRPNLPPDPVNLIIPGLHGPGQSQLHLFLVLTPKWVSWHVDERAPCMPSIEHSPMMSA